MRCPLRMAGCSLTFGSLLVLYLALGHLAPAQTPAVREHFLTARTAQDAGDLDRAASEYLAVTRLDPSLPEAFDNLGLVYFVQGKIQESANVLLRGVHLAPDAVGANLYLGIDEVKLGQPAKAFVFLKRALRLDPDSKEAAIWLGTAYWDAGKIPAALNRMRSNAAKYSGDPGIVFALGEAYRKAADRAMESLIRDAGETPFGDRVFAGIYLEQHALEKAAGHYRHALLSDPGGAGLHFGLGEAALGADRLDEAAAEYRQELRVDPRNAAGHARLAEIMLLQSDVGAAHAEFSLAIGISPLDAACALGLPPSFATSGDSPSETMLERLRRVLPILQAAPADPESSLALAFVANRLGLDDSFRASWSRFEPLLAKVAPVRDASVSFKRQDFDHAEGEIQEWLALHPSDLKARYLEAQIYRSQSLAVLGRLLRNFPDSSRSHQLMGQIHEQKEEDDKALAEYRRAAELEPTLPGIHYEIGHLLFKDGDHEKALAAFAEELRIDPRHPEANAETGFILVEEQRPEDAAVYLEKALTLDPSLMVAHKELGQAYYQEQNYTKAIPELKLALADDPEGTAHYQLGLTYKAMGRAEDAKREFDASRHIKAEHEARIKIELPPGGSQ